MFEVDADAPVVTADIEKTTTAITVEPVIETEGQSQNGADSQLETAPPVSDTVDVHGDKPVVEEQQLEVTVEQQTVSGKICCKLTYNVY